MFRLEICDFFVHLTTAMPRGRKSRRVQSAAASSGSVPIAQAVRLQRTFDASHALTVGGSLMRARREDEEFGQSWTPYGQLLKHLDLEYEERDGSMTKVTYVCPRALLHMICETSPHFAAFVAEYIGVIVLGEAWLSKEVIEAAQGGSMIFYFDEVRPGNVHRPDMARLYQGIYWSLLEFPEWFRSSQNSWFPLCYLGAKAVVQFDGGISELMAAILQKLFSPAEGGENLAREGVRVPLNQEEPRAFLYALLPFGCFLGDEAALKAVTCSMGAAGVKLCVCCINVVGSRRYPTPAAIPPGSSLVHFTDHRKNLIQLHTRETILWVADHLAERATGGPSEMTPDQFRRLETDIGFRYRPKGLLWSIIRAIAAVPDSVYWDTMHILYASGGVVQRELNQFLHRVKAHHDLGHISNVINSVVFPKSLTKLDIDLEQRVASKPRGCLRAFASETIMILTGMAVVCDEVLEPRAQLGEEVECLRCLVRLSDLLRRGDEALESIHLVEASVEEHHRRFVKLYFHSATWKLHALQHIPDLIRRFGKNLTCFAPEHKHRVSKRIASFAYRNWTKTMTVRATRQLLLALSEPDATRPFALFGPKPRALTSEQMILLIRNGVPLPPPRHADTVVCGKHLKTPRGRIFSGDFAAFRDVGNSVGRGFAKCFFHVKGAGGTYYALLAVAPRGEDLPPHSHREHRDGEESNALVEASSLLGACPYYRKGAIIRALEATRL